MAMLLAFLFLLGIIYNGFTIMTLWNWFIPSIFVGLPSITLILGLALDVVISYFIPTNTGKKNEFSKEDLSYSITQSYVKTTMFLVLAFIIKVIGGF